MKRQRKWITRLRKTMAVLLALSLILSFITFPAQSAEPEAGTDTVSVAETAAEAGQTGALEQETQPAAEPAAETEAAPVDGDVPTDEEAAEDTDTQQDPAVAQEEEKADSDKDAEAAADPDKDQEEAADPEDADDQAQPLRLSQTLADGTLITATAPAGTLPEGAELAVSKEDPQEAAAIVLAAMGYGDLAKSLDGSEDLTKLIASYTISFVNDGASVRPQGPVTVTVSNSPVDMYQFGGQNMVLWQIAGSNAQQAAVSAADDDAVTFQTDRAVQIALTGQKAGATAGGKHIRRAPSQDQRNEDKTGIDWFDNTVIQAAQYAKVDKDQKVQADENGKALEDGTYTGTLKAAIPASAMFDWLGGHLDDEIYGTKVKDFYPHGDGKYIIGGVVIEANFPAGTVLGNVTVDKGTSAFSKYAVHDGTYGISHQKSSGCTGTTYSNTLSYSGASNAKSIFLTFSDENFAGIYNQYKTNPNAVVSLSIPYTCTVKKGDDLSSIGNVTLQAQTWSHISRNLKSGLYLFGYLHGAHSGC